MHFAGTPAMPSTLFNDQLAWIMFACNSGWNAEGTQRRHRITEPLAAHTFASWLAIARLMWRRIQDSSPAKVS
jgi:hypothetical protein